METTTYFRGTRDELVERIYGLRDQLSGKARDDKKVIPTFLNAVGMAALTDISEAYKIKARGGTDAMGYSFEPLKLSTIKSRRHTETPAGYTDALRDFEKNRRKMMLDERVKALDRMSIRGVSGAKAEAIANEVANAYVRTQRQKLKDMVANQDVEILIDTQRMFNSLSPGMARGESYVKPSGKGGSDQVFDIDQASVTIGTNVEYAAKHQRGDPTENLPARKFLPDSPDDIPLAWWENWMDAGVKAVQAMTQTIFNG